MRTSLLASLVLASALAACGDTLVDHRNTAIQDTGGGFACTDEAAVICGSDCLPQTVNRCGSSCQPCGAPLAGQTVSCTPIGNHEGRCDYTCEPGLLVCATGCCPAALVASGGSFSCAATSVSDGGEVHCWGAGDQGQLGNGVAADRSTSSTVPGLSAVAGLAAGAAHACASSGGVTRCWGARAGFGGSGVASTPEVVAALAGADPATLTAGGGHTCAIVSGSVRCTGAATAGGGTPALTGTALQVSAGDAFSCALVDVSGARSVWCWGDGTFGQLGTGDSRAATAAPVAVTLPATVQHLDAGARHACASTDAQTDALLCWGDNTTKQLGDFAGTLLGPSVNLRVKKPIVAVGAGGLASCAVEVDVGNVLSCWSTDAFVAGGPSLVGEPNQIAFGTPPGPLSVGGSHACFVEAAVTPGRLRCFGHDEAGQLGDGGAAASSANPVLVVDR